MSVQNEEYFHSRMGSSFVPIYEWMVTDYRESKSSRFLGKRGV